MNAIVVWCCAPSEQAWGEALSAEQEARFALEEDLALEAVLNPPTEETHVEMEDAFWCEQFYRDATRDDADEELEDRDDEFTTCVWGAA